MAIEAMVNEVLGQNVMEYVRGYKNLVFELHPRSVKNTRAHRPNTLGVSRS